MVVVQEGVGLRVNNHMCPFCHGLTMMVVVGRGKGIGGCGEVLSAALVVGFFTCYSCDVIWCVVMCCDKRRP